MRSINSFPIVFAVFVGTSFLGSTIWPSFFSLHFHWEDTGYAKTGQKDRQTEGQTQYIYSEIGMQTSVYTRRLVIGFR